MEKNKFLKRDNSPIGRLLVAFVAVFLAIGGYAQEQHFARLLTLETDSTVITVYTFDNDSTNRWIKGTKNKPNGIITDTSYYFLLHGAFLPTLGERSGNMWYDGEIIPLDGVVFGSIKVSNIANQKVVEDLPELKLSLEWRRTVFGYDKTRIVYGGDTILLDNKLLEKYKDSIEQSRKEDKVVLRVECDKFSDNKHHFAIIVKDSPKPIKRKDFIIGKEVELGSDLITKLGIRLNDEQTDVEPIERIAVVARGCPYSFIKEVQFAQNEDRTKILQVPKENRSFPLWIWIAFGVLVLVALCFFVLRFFFKKKTKGKSRKKFSFDLGSILVDTAYPDLIAKLQNCSETSMNFKEDPEKGVVSFEVNSGNVKQLAQSLESQQGFLYELKKFIEEAKPDRLPPQKKAAFAKKIEAAKRQLDEINKYVMQLMGLKDEADEEGHVDTNDESSPQIIEGLKNELETYKKAFADLQRVLGENYQKPSELVEKVAELKRNKKNLQEEVESWKTQTDFDSPYAAHDGISKLKSSIKTLQEKNAILEAEKGKLKNTVDRVKDDPKSFKGDKEFRKLSDLIVDAEEGGKVRDKLNSDPDAIEPNSNTGILVRKGRILDKYVLIANDIFKKKDSETEIEKAIKDSPIAIRVRKGDFLDKAKDDVAMIRNDEQGWLGDCELKTFIEYIVNPDGILKTKTRTNTGLYKLMYDIDNQIATSGIARKKIDMDNLQYNWLKQRIEKVVEGYDDYLNVEFVASRYGTPEFDTMDLKGDVKLVIDCAESYRKFGEYKHYWKNIASPLFNTLDSLQAHDEIHNTRALMFYTSQFYSIACIMNEIYGDLSYSTVRPKYNASLFNSIANPAPTYYGFPILDEETLQKCRFEYKGAPDEDAKVKYMKQYKPLPFIFIFSYFDDNTLA